MEIPCKGCGWAGCPYQPSATGSPPSDQDFWEESNGWTQKWMGLRGPGPPRPQRSGPNQRRKQARELLLKWKHLLLLTVTWTCATPVLDQAQNRWYWIKYPSKSITDVYLHTCMMMWGAHIQEMLDIGAIWKLSQGPWASAVVLVWKKDGLRFCIDLRKLNNQTIKDAYLLPHIDKTLSSLQVLQWLSSRNLKSGYWQVEMDEESKPLTGFTVGPLGFYKCERIPFRFTNAPETFQQLIESCLGDLNLHWCIIYLDDIVIFSKDLASHLERLEAVI